MVPMGGLEPPTWRLWNVRSNRLSYIGSECQWRDDARNTCVACHRPVGAMSAVRSMAHQRHGSDYNKNNTLIVMEKQKI